MAGLKARGWVRIQEEECNGCGMCVVVCPMGCLEPSGNVNARGARTVRFASRGCRADGLCFRVCPESRAITVFRGESNGAS